MREITYREAIREALDEEMAKDRRVFLLGEDIGRYGGNFSVTKGLWEKYGDERVKDTPISEAGFTGMAVGAALLGMRPVVEIMFADFMALAMDQIVNQAAKIRYMTGGQVKVPLVIRTPLGGGRSSAAQHSQSPHAWFMHVPGLKIAIPATPYDAKGLLKRAIREDDPVLFFEHKFLYGIRGAVPEEEYEIPLGVAQVLKEGEDLTVVAISLMVQKVLSLAQEFSIQGIELEVIDVRTLRPLDKETIVESVKKTSRLLIVDEGPRTLNVATEIATLVTEEAFDYLDTPIKRVTGLDAPIPFSPPLEKFVLPDDADIREAMRSFF